MRVLELPEGTRVQDVIEQMRIDQRQAQMILVNGLQERDVDRVLKHDDVLSIFPPLAGG